MKPHKHAELIKAWADGAEIEVYQPAFGRWEEAEPAWHTSFEYRIKPEPKPEPEKQWLYIYNNAVEGKTWVSAIAYDLSDTIYCQYMGKIEVLK